MQKKRYPGVRPFEADDKALFFGRERDVRDLSVLMALEKLVVLFGKSGYGKSSLINAGLLPEWAKMTNSKEAEFLPIVVRLGSFVEGSSLSPTEILLARLSEKTPDSPASAFLETLMPERTLWYHFKRKSGNHARFLLVFDQFEEFFTYPIGFQENFVAQLADLLYADQPQSVWEASLHLEKDQRHMLAEPMEVKVLFSIRADRMSRLDSMKGKLPAILNKRFELKGLSEEQAQEAILKPAALPMEAGGYDTPAFSYSPEAMHLILQKLGEGKQTGQAQGIEAFQLQILCEYLEGEVAAGRIPGNCIEPVHFANKINDIYEGYYQRLLNKLPPKTARAAQRLIEESLIFNDEKTGESRRLSVDSDVLAQRYASAGVTHETLQQLENAFLLRREANGMGGFSYEVSHDTLVAPILRLKAERLSSEKRRRMLAFVGATLLALAGVVIVVVYVLALRNEAVENEKKALENEKKALNALYQVEQAQAKIKLLAPTVVSRFLDRGDTYFKSEDFDLAKSEYETALTFEPENAEVKKKIEDCNTRMRKK